MTLLKLPTELILLIASSLPESGLAYFLQAHRSLYETLLPTLYQRHVQNNRLHVGLFRSVATGNQVAVKHFLHYGADVNGCIGIIPIRHARIPFEPWFDAQTPLSIAANLGNNTLVDLLLKHGADVEEVTVAWGIAQPAVVDALFSGHESTVRLLLKHGSPIQKPIIELGGLVNCAIAKGQISFLKLLLEFGADLNIPWKETYPLSRAVSSPYISTEIVRFLLDHGADISLADGDSGRLLNQAIYGTTDTLRLLLDRGVTYPPDQFDTWLETWVCRCAVETLDIFLQCGYVPSKETLWILVRARRGDLLQLLIDSGMDLNIKNERGSTLLHTAVLRCIPSDTPAVGLARISHCYRRFKHNLVRKIEPVPQQVSPPCLYDAANALKKGPPEEIVRCLIRGGADPNALDAQGRTPLARAREHCPTIQQILVDAGCIED